MSALGMVLPLQQKNEYNRFSVTHVHVLRRRLNAWQMMWSSNSIPPSVVPASVLYYATPVAGLRRACDWRRVVQCRSRYHRGWDTFAPPHHLPCIQATIRPMYTCYRRLNARQMMWMSPSILPSLMTAFALYYATSVAGSRARVGC